MKMQAAESESSQSTSIQCPHVFAAVYYIGASTSLTIFNKLLFNAFTAVDPLLLLLFQALTTLSLFLALTLTKRFRVPTLPTDRNVFLAYLPLLLSYAVMLTTSLIALRFTSLLMYNTIRRTSLLFVVVLHSWSSKSYPATYTVTATVLTLVGALFASMTDLEFDPFGYSLAILANAATAIFLVLLRPVRDRLNYTNMQLLFFNTLCITPLLGCLLFVMPPQHSILPLFASSSSFCILFALSCAMAVVITHATYVNTTVNDAVTQTVSAQVKDVLLLSVSYFYIDSAAGRASGNVFGVAIGFCGSVIYGFGKLLESRAETPSSSSSLAPEVGVSNAKYARVTEDEAQS